MDLSGSVWVADVGVELLGNRFALRTDDPVAAEVLTRLFAPVLSPRHPVPGRRQYSLVADEDEGYVAYADCQRVGASPRLGAALDALLTSLNAAAVADTEAFAVHAGVVELDGGAVAFAAESGTGKSTLTAALVAAGCGYVSDEALCVDYATSRVLPYPKPIALDATSCALLGLEPALPAEAGDERLFTAADLSSSAVATDLELRHVVRLVRDGSGGGAGLLAEPAGAAVSLLLGMSFNHYKRPQDAFLLAGALARSVRTWTLHLGAPGADAALVREALGTIRPF